MKLSWEGKVSTHKDLKPLVSIKERSCLRDKDILQVLNGVSWLRVVAQACNSRTWGGRTRNSRPAWDT